MDIIQVKNEAILVFYCWHIFKIIAFEILEHISQVIVSSCLIFFLPFLGRKGGTLAMAGPELLG